jgi:hypothetical protein
VFFWSSLLFSVVPRCFSGMGFFGRRSEANHGHEQTHSIAIYSMVMAPTESWPRLSRRYATRRCGAGVPGVKTPGYFRVVATRLLGRPRSSRALRLPGVFIANFGGICVGEKHVAANAAWRIRAFVSYKHAAPMELETGVVFGSINMAVQTDLGGTDRQMLRRSRRIRAIGDGDLMTNWRGCSLISVEYASARNMSLRMQLGAFVRSFPINMPLRWSLRRVLFLVL